MTAEKTEKFLSPKVKSITPLTFADHHNFSHNDIQLLNDTFEQMASPKCIITTEKDAARLLTTEGLSDNVRKHLYQLPVRISFLLEQGQKFDQHIIGYVQKNARHFMKSKPKGEHPAKTGHSTKGDHTTKSGQKDDKRPHTIKFK